MNKSSEFVKVKDWIGKNRAKRSLGSEFHVAVVSSKTSMSAKMVLYFKEDVELVSYGYNILVDNLLEYFEYLLICFSLSSIVCVVTY